MAHTHTVRHTNNLCARVRAFQLLPPAALFCCTYPFHIPESDFYCSCDSFVLSTETLKHFEHYCFAFIHSVVHSHAAHWYRRSFATTMEIHLYTLNPFACHGIYLYDICDIYALLRTLHALVLVLLFMFLLSNTFPSPSSCQSNRHVSSRLERIILTIFVSLFPTLFHFFSSVVCGCVQKTINSTCKRGLVCLCVHYHDNIFIRI